MPLGATLPLGSHVVSEDLEESALQYSDGGTKNNVRSQILKHCV